MATRSSASRTYLTSNIRKGVPRSNTQNYSNPKVDELLAKAAIEMDVNKRKALYAEFQEIVVEDAPIIYINMANLYSAYNKDLSTVPFNGIWHQMTPMDEIYWDKKPKN